MLRNTEASYGSVAKWLHWLVALWVLAAYVIIFYILGKHDGDGPIPGLDYHKAVGFSILIPVSIRLFWRVTNPVPNHFPKLANWQVLASRISHFLLYFFLFAMPVTGYLGNGGGVNYGIFRITAFRRTGLGNWIMETFDLTREQLEAPFDVFHYQIVGPYILWMLILLHASAAIFHHVVQKDDTLIRMLPGRTDN